jgi:hypothetical protein
VRGFADLRIQVISAAVKHLSHELLRELEKPLDELRQDPVSLVSHKSVIMTRLDIYVTFHILFAFIWANFFADDDPS